MNSQSNIEGRTNNNTQLNKFNPEHSSNDINMQLVCSVKFPNGGKFKKKEMLSWIYSRNLLPRSTKVQQSPHRLFQSYCCSK